MTKFLYIICFVILFNLKREFLCCDKHKWFFYEKDPITALILARGGSKGIPLKNLAKIGGQSLLKLSLTTILNNKRFSSVWVSTDNIAIVNEIVKISNEVNIHWRSEDTARDDSSSLKAIQEFLKIHPELQKIILIQLTSPFVKEIYLHSAFQELKESECVFSVTRSYKLRWKETDNGLVPLNFDPKSRPRRQDWKGELVENGMFYGATRTLLMNGFIQSLK